MASVSLPIELDPLIAEAKQRARRRRLLAAGVVALAFAGTAVGVATSESGGSSGTVPWLPTKPSLGPSNPPLAAPCTAAQLHGTLGIQGAAGNLVGLIWLTNRSNSACSLVGQPKLSFVGATSRWLTAGWQTGALGRPTTYDPLTPRPGSLRALLPGRSAATYLVWSDWCGAGSVRNGDPGQPPAAIAVTAPGGGRVVLSKDTWGGRPLGAPPCYGSGPSRMALSRFTPYVPQGPPSSALPLTARITAVGTRHLGAWLSYTVVLRNRSSKPFSFGRTCPAYYEDFGGRPTAYVLNCRAVGPIPPHGSVRFAMRIRVPRDAHLTTLTWNLAPHSWNGGVLAQRNTGRP
jgi:hypothetical protein